MPDGGVALSGLHGFSQRANLIVQTAGKFQPLLLALLTRLIATLARQTRSLPLHIGKESLGTCQMLRSLPSQKAGRVQGQNQLATIGQPASPLIPRQRFRAGHVANQRPGKQLDHRRQRRAAHSRRHGQRQHIDADAVAQRIHKAAEADVEQNIKQRRDTDDDAGRARELADAGMKALGAGRRGDAESLFHQAIAYDNRNVKALMGLSDVYFDNGAKVKAVFEIMSYSNGLTRNIVQCLEDFGIPLYLGHSVTAIHGKDRVTGVTVAQVNDNLSVDTSEPEAQYYTVVRGDTLSKIAKEHLGSANAWKQMSPQQK